VRAPYVLIGQEKIFFLLHPGHSIYRVSVRMPSVYGGVKKIFSNPVLHLGLHGSRVDLQIPTRRMQFE
jgi:hypothetical protein